MLFSEGLEYDISIEIKICRSVPAENYVLVSIELVYVFACLQQQQESQGRIHPERKEGLRFMHAS